MSKYPGRMLLSMEGENPSSIKTTKSATEKPLIYERPKPALVVR